MPVSTVFAPDGSEIEVRHPPNASDHEIRMQGKKIFEEAAAEEAKNGDWGDRARELGAGLAFEYGDEIEAGVKTGFGFLGDYKSERDQIRGEMSEFRENNPYESLAYNVVGSLPTMFIPGMGAANTLKGANSLGKIAAGAATTGALDGLITGSGMSENDTFSLGHAGDILKGGAMGAGVGGLLGGAVGAAGNKLAGMTADKVNGMPATAVTAELESIAKALQMSTDELVAHVNSGKLVAEIPELAPLVNAYQGAGESSRKMVQGVYGGDNPRGDVMSRQAEEQVNKTLLGADPENQILAMERRGEDLQEGVGPAYDAAKKTPVTNDGLLSTMDDLYGRFPEARAGVERLAREAGVPAPLWKEGADGVAARTDAPTIGEADHLMRLLRDLKGERYSNNQGTLADSANTAYRGLRDQLDEAAPDLAAARRKVRESNVLNEGFDDFSGSVSADATTKQARLTQQQRQLASNGEGDMLPSYMEGAKRAASKQIANAIRGMSTGGSEAVKKFLQEGSNQRMLLEMVADGTDITPLLKKLDLAATSRTAQQKLLNPSATAGIQAATDRIGNTTNLSQLFTAMQGDPRAIVAMADNIGKSLKQKIKPQEIDEVMSILLSGDPKAIKAAFNGTGKRAVLTRELWTRFSAAIPATASGDVAASNNQFIEGRAQ